MIVTYSTQNYRAWTNLLLASYRQSNPKRSALVYCMGWDDSIVQAFKREYSQYKFIPRPISDQIKQDVSASRRSGALLKLKPTLLLESYELTPTQPVLWIDADSLILKDIQPLLDVLTAGQHDFLCTARFGKRLDAEKFNVTMLGFACTDGGRKFLKLYNDETQICKGLDNWFYEQLSLWTAFNKAKPKLYQLSDSELSLVGNTSAIVTSRRVSVDIKEMAKKFGIKMPAGL